MHNPPPRAVLDRIPRLYANEEAQTPIADIIIHLHFFVAGCDWWIAEHDGDDLFFGFVNLNHDICAEWGYISYAELRSVGQSGLTAPLIDATTGQQIGQLPLFVEWDEHWTPKVFREVQWRKSAASRPLDEAQP